MAEPLPPAKELQPLKVKIADEMRSAYLDYAMSVIIGRALPDVRDGLKPVHRRVLFAMYDLGNTHDKAYKKSARVVGDVIGKYHPHGDTAVYDAIVRMAQDFSLRYPLVDGQGNFGSIDGDSPAAMRYTEIRMDKITDDLLGDLEKETVDFGTNYDDTLKEPLVLPAKFPNLLVNGSTGIAVGMATNIPPHNLSEIIDATLALIADPSLTTRALTQFVKGPDFPTAGVIYGGDGLKKAYETGRGIIKIRGRTEIETAAGDREKIIITELPYNVNKARLIEKIADLVRDKKIEGISDLRDESDKSGIRVVIDVKRGESSNVIINRLYKLTQLQDSFGISLLAIHEHQPKYFNLRDMLWAFIEHRKDVVLRRTAFDLRKAKAKAHILDGLKRAVENLDAVITLIKAAAGPAEAKSGLITKFSFSELQAQAILEMRLQRLTGLERDKIIQDYKETMLLIDELKKILESEALVYEIIKNELLEIKKNHGDARRTEIVLDEADSFEVEDLIADDATLVVVSHKGYIKRTGLAQFRSQNRGGKGIQGTAGTDGDDFVSAIYTTSLLSQLLCFTDKGRLFAIKVYKIPEASRVAKGKPIVNLLNLTPNEKVVAMLTIREFKENEYAVFMTRAGIIKKTALSQYKNLRSAGLFAITVESGDQLVDVKVSHGKDDVFVTTREAVSIRFSEEDLRPMGRSARGVIGISLDEGDEVVSMEILVAGAEGKEILTISQFGFGKRTPIGDFRLQSRAGKGVYSMKASERNGKIVAALQVGPKDQLMVVSSQGRMIRLNVDQISELGRVTQGVRIMNVEPGEKVVAIEKVPEDKMSEDNAPETETTG